MSTPSIVPEHRSLAVSAITLTKFTHIRLSTAMALREARKLPDLPAHYRQQIEAAILLLELRLHRVIGAPEGNDALSVRDDLEAIANRIVDPLIASIGEMARDELSIKAADVDKHFSEQLSDALEGNAMHVLELRAEQIEVDRRGEALEAASNDRE